MAQNPTTAGAAISESTLEGDPEIHYQLPTTGLPSALTTNIPQSIDSVNLHFIRIKKLSNKCIEFHGKEDFCVTFKNSTSNKKLSCSCSNAAQCSHVFYCLNQLANAHCYEQRKRLATGVIYPRGRDGLGQRASLEIDGERDRKDVWPLPDLQDAGYASFVSDYIHKRLGDETPEGMEEDLFSYNRHTERFDRRVDRRVTICSDRPIYAATQTSLEPIIADACIRDRELKEQVKAILTPARQTAIKLEDLKCGFAQELAALSESWLGRRIDHHEMVVKRSMEMHVYAIYNVYREYINKARARGDDDTSEATDAAASALIFMIQAAIDRSRVFRPNVTSLWRELTLTDLAHDEPTDFWTNFFFAFWAILETPEGLATRHRTALHYIREQAIELRTPVPGILDELRRIIRA
ncbi:hypothetical protein FKW77_002447 [Venturia effusa]|uniref:SWIM-type domain-containing protein n=1 Tax=Venturia effusa TaxID=50376 RepID=A0A517KVV6_9PEZI|nr:hypothetical protein FKW77_002447 [Venturia effusa]